MDDTLIRVRGLTKHFGATVALEGVDLDIARGEVLGYLGPNGAGKTTTLRILMGLIRPTAGSAAVAGLDTWRHPVEVHGHVGYVSGEPGVYERLSSRQHIEFLGHLRGTRTASRTARVGERLAERLELDLDRPAGDLSRGNRQKLAIVLALMSEPEVLLLDEPTSGLDPIAQQEFRDILREHADRGATVLLSSHILGEVQRTADRVGILRSGRLVAVEALEDMRGRALHVVHARFAEPVAAADFRGIPGILDVDVSDHSLACSAPESALDMLVKAVSRHTIVDFECTEAELEDTFLAYYGREGNGRAQHRPAEDPA